MSAVPGCPHHRPGCGPRRSLLLALLISLIAGVFATTPTNASVLFSSGAAPSVPPAPVPVSGAGTDLTPQWTSATETGAPLVDTGLTQQADAGFQYPFAGPAVADLYGDGRKEVIAGYPDGRVVAYSATGTILPGWPQQLHGPVHATPTVADLFNDGHDEVIVTTGDGTVMAFAGDGSVVPGFPVHPLFANPPNVNPGFFGAAAVGDLFGDGRQEIVAAGGDFHLYVWDNHGNIMSGFPIRLWDTVLDTPTLVDLEHNGRLDIVIGADSTGPPYDQTPPGGVMFAFRPTGCPDIGGSFGCQVPGWPKTFDQVPWASAAVINGSGSTRSVIVEGTGTNFPDPAGHYVNAWTDAGQPVFTAATGGRNLASPAVGDLFGDGSREVVETSTNGTMYVWSATGTLLWSVAGICAFGSPIIAPVDGSGGNGIWVYTDSGAVVGYRLTRGSSVTAQVIASARPTGYAPSAPAVADLGTGQMMLLALGDVGSSGWAVRAFAISGDTTMPAGAWPRFHGSGQNAGQPAPTAHVSASGSGSSVLLNWATEPGSVPARWYVGWYREGSGPWAMWLRSAGTSATFYGIPGHSYAFYIQAMSGAASAPSPGSGTPVSVTVVGTAVGGSGVYGARRDGVIEDVEATPLQASATWPGRNIVRGISVIPGSTAAGTPGGYTLDLFGGLHPFGAATAITTPAYWPGWDIARSVSVAANGTSGHLLDAWGGVHAFGGAAPASPATYNGYWPGWDIARGIATLPDGTGGYVLDGWGGIHPFGSAPRVAASAYWPGWDIARSLTLAPDGHSGWVVDGWGGVHWFGLPGQTPVPLSSGAYWPGWDIARGVVAQPGRSGGWLVDGWGGVHPLGAAPLLGNALPTPFLDFTAGVSAG